MIRNLFFDLDNTLLDFDAAEAYALPKAFAKFGIELTEDLLAHYHVFNTAQWKALEEGKLNHAQVNYNRFALTLDYLQSDAPKQDVADAYEYFLGQSHVYMDGAKQLLDTLKAEGYDMYLVTNGISTIQHNRLNGADILHYFKGVFVSGDYDCHKPSKAFFDICFKDIPNFKKEESIMIGDSLGSDILGGINAGIKTLWYNPTEKLNESAVKPDYEVKTLADIPAILKAIR